MAEQIFINSIRASCNLLHDVAIDKGGSLQVLAQCSDIDYEKIEESLTEIVANVKIIREGGARYHKTYIQALKAREKHMADLAKKSGAGAAPTAASSHAASAAPKSASKRKKISDHDDDDDALDDSGLQKKPASDRDYCECGRGAAGLCQNKKCSCFKAKRQCSTKCGPCTDNCKNRPAVAKVGAGFSLGAFTFTV